MAQLNPNFEIDFNDINSYEQIQLINDTQLAKENLLMHRAYKEPADDAIIRNHFSSFTFVDFCPRLHSARPTPSDQKLASSPIQVDGRTLRTDYELETFSDLFERINSWLKLNKEWRVVSMETLVFDCTTQFNHLKSSVRSVHLPRNTRGLRLYLSPSKSRFSGPQRIGSINVVPRKVSGSYTNPQEPVKYETLDEILSRLNDLLLNRPIEGRILSVETITLPMDNGYVNTESNYFMDARLNLLNQTIYSLANQQNPDATEPAETLATHSMIDILRVYYEFGPLICGLVNMIDFIPRFYSATPTTTHSTPGGSGTATPDPDQALGSTPPSMCRVGSGDQEQRLPEKIAATESLTRLIRRSLAWFETERKRVLADTSEQHALEDQQQVGVATRSEQAMDLKCCNVQICHKVLLKRDLIRVSPTNALEMTRTRSMAHESFKLDEPMVCADCNNSSTSDPAHTWCSHLIDLAHPYELKFVRLAYVVPVHNIYARSIYPMPRILRNSCSRADRRSRAIERIFGQSIAGNQSPLIEGLTSDSSSSASNTSDSRPPSLSRDESPSIGELNSVKQDSNREIDAIEVEEPGGEQIDIDALNDLEDLAKKSALSIVELTNERLRANELAHQLNLEGDLLNDKPIGQLTYRLFAPCQLVNSSSCFAINPVNSSSPLTRRGSVDLNGNGLSSEDAHPTALIPGQSLASSSLSLGGATCSENGHLIQQVGGQQQMPLSFGAMFPALTHELISSSAQRSSPSADLSAKGSSLSKFTTNEFESVEAIRRRMEVYVTTNSMKLIAGETLIVNLSDALSCLSTAIERTVVKASFAQRAPSTWVSVYVLYAAVGEPQLPGRLLASQKSRELEQISEEPVVPPVVADLEPVFDDDFNGSLHATPKPDRKVTPPSAGVSAKVYTVPGRGAQDESEASNKPASEPSASESEEEDTCAIRIEENQADSSLTLYNSAYQRTVALPTQPINYGDHSEPIELLSSADACMWLKTPESSQAHQRVYNTLGSHQWLRSASADHQIIVRRRKRKAGRRHEDSQCSVM